MMRLMGRLIRCCMASHTAVLLQALCLLLAAGIVVAQPVETPGPCEEFPETVLTFAFTLSPPHPVVGDEVTLTVDVRNVTDGLAGLPKYSILGTAPILAGETSIDPLIPSLGEDQFTARFRAVAAGQAEVAVVVSYETASGCRDSPIFSFTTTTSPTFEVRVDESQRIPVVTSPTSRSGLLLVVALAVTMAWALARRDGGRRRT